MATESTATCNALRIPKSTGGKVSIEDNPAPEVIAAGAKYLTLQLKAVPGATLRMCYLFSRSSVLRYRANWWNESGVCKSEFLRIEALPGGEFRRVGNVDGKQRSSARVGKSAECHGQ